MSSEQKQRYIEWTMGSVAPNPAAFLNNYGKERHTGGVTIVSVADHICQCGGTIKNKSLCPIEASFHLNHECVDCMELLTSHLACLFAGSVATSLFLPEEHKTSQANDDRQKIGQILEGIIQNQPQRQSVRGWAEERAQDLMRRHSKVVRALSDVLVGCGVLNGPEAERFIRNQL
jgi:hypothetical protein